ncbi:MAG: exodeoxyribonuclease VII small subunit [Clostridiaceae bacterium]|jgi:exodeoxyribonuclease VII small subunit|nr:exodeoxyribonuclease VII small subunit [Clostridiaceae bacterium]
MEFEKLLNELEGVVKKLESGANLDESIELFKKGIGLSRDCIANLNQSKGRILALTDEMNNVTAELKLDD